MHGVSPNRRHAERQAQLERVAGFAGPIAAGMLSRDEWIQHARELAERERQLRDAGLLDLEPGPSTRERLVAAVRRMLAPQPQPRQPHIENP